MDLTLDTDVLAARTGDRRAFARIVTRYRGLVASISLATVGNVAISEEVAQDVFLAVWRDLATLRNPSSFLPWLRQLTRHRALDAVRGGRRLERGAPGDALEAAIDPRPGAQEMLLADERARAVALGLDALPDDAREVITLYYREGQSIEQVARLLGLRTDTAKKRLSRAREALRDEVHARFAEAVESTAPGEGFSRELMGVLPALSPATTVVLVKGAMHLLAKWASLAAGGVAGLAGVIGGVLPIVASIRREVGLAVDERERRELRTLGVAASLNVALFALGIPMLAHMHVADGRKVGAIWAVGFSALHMAIFGLWLPRAKARRRSAAIALDPVAAARDARASSISCRWAAFATVTILGAAIVAWLR